MRNLLKRICVPSISSILAVSAITVSVSAKEVYCGLSDIPPTCGSNEKISPQNNDYPEKVWDLSKKGIYTSNANAFGNAPIYTLYRLTGIRSISVCLANRNSCDLEVTVYKCGTADTTIEYFTVAAGSIGVKIILDLYNSNQYYFEFSAPCDFAAYAA